MTAKITQAAIFYCDAFDPPTNCLKSAIVDGAVMFDRQWEPPGRADVTRCPPGWIHYKRLGADLHICPECAECHGWKP